MATIAIGKIKLVNKNTWDTNATYSADDIVQYTDTGNNILSTYICVVASSQGHTPSSNGTTHASWNFLAKGGNPTGGFTSHQVFTTVGTATWTKPSGIQKVIVTVTGGGGGGGGGRATFNQGGGGGGGATAIEVIDVTSVSTVSVTVGDQGSGGTENNNGYDGGTSSFGSYCSATGGMGGRAAQSGSRCQGGTATGGDINLAGGDGNSAGGGNSSDEGVSGHNAGFNARVYGSGGGGGDRDSSGTTQGGSGESGIVYVEEFK